MILFLRVLLVILAVVVLLVTFAVSLVELNDGHWTGAAAWFAAFVLLLAVGITALVKVTDDSDQSGRCGPGTVRTVEGSGKYTHGVCVGVPR